MRWRNIQRNYVFSVFVYGYLIFDIWNSIFENDLSFDHLQTIQIQHISACVEILQFNYWLLLIELSINTFPLEIR